jgi:hypothetical protein
MKSLAFKLSGFILLSLFVLSCSKTAVDSSSPGSLKDALTSGTQKLNIAMTDIASNQAFQLLSITNPTTLKAATVYSVNIPLSLVTGVYNFKALKTEGSEHLPLIKFFTKTADPNKMVINLPLAKLKNSHDLREYHKADSTLTNNFSMSVTEYYNNYNNYRDFDYSNVAAITIDKVLAGSLNIKSLRSPTLGTQYASQFAFSNGYTAKYKYSSGDTIVSSFSILKASSVLYEEKLLTIKNDTARFGREHQYSLIIGDVKLVKKANKTYAVYVKGILQPKAVVSFIDKDENENEDSEHSVCDKRDIQITFEDGTTSTLSTLIGQTITDISTLFKSLHQVYFAASVADWIGYDIYYKR